MTKLIKKRFIIAVLMLALTIFAMVGVISFALPKVNEKSDLKNSTKTAQQIEELDESSQQYIEAILDGKVTPVNEDKDLDWSNLKVFEAATGNEALNSDIVNNHGMTIITANYSDTKKVRK